MKKWATFANQHPDFTKTGAEDLFWDSYFGVKKATHHFLNDTEIMNADGRAAEDLGFLFAGVNITRS